MNRQEYEENPGKISKTSDVDQKTPMDIEDKSTVISEKPYLECSGMCFLHFIESMFFQRFTNAEGANHLAVFNRIICSSR